MANESTSKVYIKILVVLAVAAGCVVAFYRMGLRQGLDLSGGTELLYRIRVDKVPLAKRVGLTQRTIDVIRRRVDPRGTESLDIRARGKNRFYIQIPHRKKGDAERIEQRLQRAGNLLFCLVEDRKEKRAQAYSGKPVPGHTVFIKKPEPGVKIKKKRYYKRTFAELAADKPADGDWYLVKNKPMVTGKYLAKAYPTVDNMHQNAVGFEFYGKGKHDFANGTGQNIGRQMAIILDSILYSAPTIRARISGSGVIEGRFTNAELSDLITTLEAGTLPADIVLEWKHMVGPGLGRDSIRKGERAIMIGLILVLLFMACYYLVAGCIADFAVALNLVFIVGIMSLMRVALTLPGLAGLVLTVGMAVDANVLIYERIREELSRGKGLRLAIRSGYERAFITIIDSNLTTLISAFILFGVGTGPVRGFAITLSLGILASMFTSLVVTRLVFEALMERGWLHRLRMFQFFKRPSFRYSRVRHAAMAVSFVLICIGVTVFFLRGNEKYDSDLVGGLMVDIELDRGMPTTEFRRRVSEVFKGADVQQVMDGSVSGAEAAGGLPNRFLIRVKDLSEDNNFQAEKIRSDVGRLIAKKKLGRADSVKRLGAKLTFDIRLAKPIDEGVLRVLLRDIGYREGDVKQLVAQGVKAENYIFYLRESGKEDERPEANIARVLSALGDLVVTRDYRVEKIGRPEGDEAGDRGPRARVTWRLDFRLRDVCAPEAIREALIAQCLGGKRPKDLSVVSSSKAEAGAREIRDVRVRTDLDALKALRQALAERKSLEVASFRQQGVSTLRVALKAPQPESVIWARLREAEINGKLAKGAVRAVLPQGVEEAHFVAYMRDPLREAKVLDKVREDLLACFRDELSRDSYKVTFSPAKAPKAAAARFLQAEGKWYALKLDKPMQIQEIAGKLRQAGAPQALAYLQEKMREQAQKSVREIVVKLPDKSGLREEIAEAFSTPEPFQRIESVGKVVAGEMRNKAVLAMIIALIAIVFYIWMRFGELKFGIAAIVALAHDVLMTMGAIAVADALSGSLLGRALYFSDIKINVEMIAAFLTIVGYSLNDTIVVFDRIRENIGGARRRIDPEIIDNSVNQCLSRTLLTSLTTLIVVVVLYLWGGAVIHGFAFALMVGVVVGTYSSIFIASPILVDWESITGFIRKFFRVITFRFN